MLRSFPIAYCLLPIALFNAQPPQPASLPLTRFPLRDRLRVLVRRRRDCFLLAQAPPLSGSTLHAPAPRLSPISRFRHSPRSIRPPREFAEPDARFDDGAAGAAPVSPLPPCAIGVKGWARNRNAPGEVLAAQTA